MGLTMRFWFAGLAAILLLTATPSAAAPVDLFRAEVPFLRNVASTPGEAREQAYAAALDAVIARIVPFESRAQAQAVFEQPAQWVQGWREGENNTLVVTFDGRALTSMLRAQRIPVWGEERPTTLVWLAVEDGRGNRLLLDSFEPPEPEPAPVADTPQVPLVEAGVAPSGPALPPTAAYGAAIAEAAQRFGIPVMLPRYDESDLASVTPSDIWGGFSDVIVAASARYDVESILIGRVNARNASSIRWTWVFGDNESRFAGDVNVAFARVGGRLMSQFASSPEGSADVRISVVAVDGLADYARLVSFLSGRSLVEDVRVLAMRGDHVLLSVDALAGRERLARLLEGTVLERIEPPLRAVPFAGRAGGVVLGRPEAPVTLGEIANAMPPTVTVGPDDGASPESIVTVPGMRPPPAFEEADLFYRLRPAGGVGD